MSAVGSVVAPVTGGSPAARRGCLGEAKQEVSL
jgi:hypothetical protein